ncbi:MAG: hypothetical protein A2Y65_05650 [Deltaproteobacteria bacterium RBG_13_52_11]|nr:MAG: hypothetical protein A2Y65_05650 [Deltaproteobacteria bacterium RBG_13_52_11]
MAKCKHLDICGLNADFHDGLCILHSALDKNKNEFAKRFEEHRKNKGDNFRYFVFPERIDFGGTTFTTKASFVGATFTEEAYFTGATFSEKADFLGATFAKKASFPGARFAKEASFAGATFTKEAQFSDTRFAKGAEFVEATFTEWTWFTKATVAENANFVGATFTKEAYFLEATFAKWTSFAGATFAKEAYFTRVTFSEEAYFTGATFVRGASFEGAIFEKGDVSFDDSHLLGRTLFLGGKTARFIFSNVNVSFKNMDINPPNAVIFRDADLGRCSFLGTRINQVEFTNVKWAMIPGKFGYSRTGIYDEKILLDSIKSTKKSKKKDKKNLDWEHIERICRDLKINHTASGDHERAGDFHYGEKGMRRRNPSTPLMHRFFLNLYRILSGYGERYLRPLFWALFIMIGCTIGYLAFGIQNEYFISLGFDDWSTVLLYSLQIMTLLKPTELQPIGVASTAIKVFQSISGPIILGLFALAIRQRLKR